MTDARPNIWRLQAQSDVDGLIKALENGDPDIRLRAAIALRALSATEAISPLRSRLAVEDDAEVRTNLTQVLVFLLEEHEERSEQQKSAPLDETTLLVSQLKSKDVEDIIHAAQALGALGDPIAAEPLIVLFNNLAMPPNVRLAAAEALIELKSPPTSVTALVALRRPDWHIRRIAAAMLGHLEADWAVEPLRKALADENELVRRTARAALKHIGTPEALKAAESVPEEPSPEAVPTTTSPKGEEEPPVKSPESAPPEQEAAPTEPPTTASVASGSEESSPATESQPAAPSPETVAVTPQVEESLPATTPSPDTTPENAASSEVVPTTDEQPGVESSEPAPEKTESQPSIPDATPKVENLKTEAQPVPPSQPTPSVPASTDSKTEKHDTGASNDGASSAVESAEHSTSKQ